MISKVHWLRFQKIVCQKQFPFYKIAAFQIVFTLWFFGGEKKRLVKMRVGCKLGTIAWIPIKYKCFFFFLPFRSFRAKLLLQFLSAPPSLNIYEHCKSLVWLRIAHAANGITNFYHFHRFFTIQTVFEFVSLFSCGPGHQLKYSRLP